MQYEREGFGGRKEFEEEWWENLNRSDLLNSAENLDRKLEALNASKTELEGTQSALRHIINTLSRPHLRNLNILDLPDEILLEIFEHVEDLKFHPPYSELLYYVDEGREDIRNTRLVCRRFCNVNSQLLVRLVRVNPNKASLARLEEISRHPTIVKGVRVVRVVLHFYNSSFTDRYNFVQHHADELEGQINMYEDSKMWELDKIPEQTALEMIAKGRAVLSTLDRLLSAEDGGRCSKRDKNHRVRIADLHRKYLKLLEDQASLIEGGQFARAVGCAMARMPGARRLDFGDAGFQSLNRQLITEGDIWGALYRLMLQPVTAYDARKNELELPSYQYIVRVTDAVRSAGALLDRIDIKLSTVGSPGGLVPVPDARTEFSSGMKQMKEFSFKFGGCLEEREPDDLKEFLSACVDTSSLRKLRLDMRGDAEGARIDVGKIIGLNSRPELMDIFFGYVAMDLPWLVLFLERLPQSLRCIYLDDVRLLSGTWKEALDMLRKKRYDVVLLKRLRGAECDAMSPETYENIFGDEDQTYRSVAELYVGNRSRWTGSNNPLQALAN
jgi:hypothetical protein